MISRRGRTMAGVVTVIAALGACARSEGPDVLVLDAARYGEAFEAALEAARVNDLTPELRDRRRGVIETQPSIAGSILEPWRSGNASLGQAMENTVAFQRRRARFEFSAEGVKPSPAPGGVAGPDLLAMGPPPIDLERHEGRIELRVSVVLERAHAPGLRRDTWSRANTSRARIRRPATDAAAETNDFWTPVARDPAFERRLLAAVESSLAGR